MTEATWLRIRALAKAIDAGRAWLPPLVVRRWERLLERLARYEGL